jgi:hypothetical protein
MRYAENQTMISIYEAQQAEVDKVFAFIKDINKNNFITTADIEGILAYEKILGISADEINDDLELRRLRVINKLALRTPFTRIFLEQMLETIFGHGNWTLEIDPVALTMFMYVITDSPQIYNQTVSDIGDIVPANIEFSHAGEVPYTHIYLNTHHTHESMEQFTFGELSQFA